MEIMDSDTEEVTILVSALPVLSPIVTMNLEALNMVLNLAIVTTMVALDMAIKDMNTKKVSSLVSDLLKLNLIVIISLEALSVAMDLAMVTTTLAKVDLEDATKVTVMERDLLMLNLTVLEENLAMEDSTAVMVLEALDMVDLAKDTEEMDIIKIQHYELELVSKVP